MAKDLKIINPFFGVFRVLVNIKMEAYLFSVVQFVQLRKSFSAHSIF